MWEMARCSGRTALQGCKTPLMKKDGRALDWASGNEKCIGSLVTKEYFLEIWPLQSVQYQSVLFTDSGSRLTKD